MIGVGVGRTEHFRRVQAGRAVAERRIVDEGRAAVIVPAVVEARHVRLALVGYLDVGETIIVERGKYIDFGVMPTAPVTIQTGSFTLSAGQDYGQGWTLDF